MPKNCLYAEMANKDFHVNSFVYFLITAWFLLRTGSSGFLLKTNGSPQIRITREFQTQPRLSTYSLLVPNHLNLWVSNGARWSREASLIFDRRLKNVLVLTRRYLPLERPWNRKENKNMNPRNNSPYAISRTSLILATIAPDARIMESFYTFKGLHYYPCFLIEILFEKKKINRLLGGGKHASHLHFSSKLNVNLKRLKPSYI